MADSVSLGAIGQIARGVKDIAAASKFYGEVLGLHRDVISVISMVNSS